MRIGIFLVLLLAINTALLANKTLAIVNGDKITQNDIKALLSANPNVNYETLPQDTKDKILSSLIDKKLLLSVAKKAKIQKTKKYKEAMQLFKENIIFNLWLEKKSNSQSVSLKEIKRNYKENKDSYREKQKVKARHILLKTEQEAKSIINTIKKSSNKKKTFIKLAKEKSTGPSASKGGELGWFDRNQMVAPFSKAAFSLKKNKFTKKPVKTQFGYHVIYVEDKTKAGLQKLSQVKDKIKKELSTKKFKKYIEKTLKTLRKKAKIKIL
jgi:parvulin-like peptidyl-prolyl isomerase